MGRLVGLEPFETYNKKVGRFVSEYGFQGMPDYSTFKKIATENDLNFNSAAVKIIKNIQVVIKPLKLI